MHLKRTVPMLNRSGSMPWRTTSWCGPERAKVKLKHTIPWWAHEPKPVRCPIGMQHVAPRNWVQILPNGYLIGMLSTKALECSRSEPPWQCIQWSGTVRYCSLPKALERRLILQSKFTLLLKRPNWACLSCFILPFWPYLTCMSVNSPYAYTCKLGIRFQ